LIFDWSGVDGTDADGGEQFILPRMHALGQRGSNVVVALDVEEAVEAVEEEFVAEGVAEFVGAAAGDIQGDDGVEVDGVSSFEFRVSRLLSFEF